jgi:hypothetical protein
MLGVIFGVRDQIAGRFSVWRIPGPASQLLFHTHDIFHFVASGRCLCNMFASVWRDIIGLCRIR